MSDALMRAPEVKSADADATAIVAIDRQGRRTTLTYAELRRATNRFANLLESLGARASDTMFVLLPRRPELHVCVLGAMKSASFGKSVNGGTFTYPFVF